MENYSNLVNQINKLHGQSLKRSGKSSRKEIWLKLSESDREFMNRLNNAFGITFVSGVIREKS